MNFVKRHKGAWNHQDWLGFLDFLKEKGYDRSTRTTSACSLKRKGAVSRSKNAIRFQCTSPYRGMNFPVGEVFFRTAMQKTVIALSTGDAAGIGPRTCGPYSA